MGHQPNPFRLPDGTWWYADAIGRKHGPYDCEQDALYRCIWDMPELASKKNKPGGSPPLRIEGGMGALVWVVMIVVALVAGIAISTLAIRKARAADMDVRRSAAPRCYHISSITGRYVTPAYAIDHADTTVRVCRRSQWPASRKPDRVRGDFPTGSASAAS